MKARSLVFFSTAYLCAMACNSVVVAQQITVTPTANANYLLNPGKGWVVYTDFSNVNAAVWSKASVGYKRYRWADIHTGENTYNWPLIDTLKERCASLNKQFAFGVMPCVVNSASSYSSMPQWVIDAGAQYTFATGAPLCKVPVWNDPIFIAKMQQFVTALHQRYNGDSTIAYIDNATYGNWGEWHLYNVGGVDPGDAVKNAFVDMFAVFDKTFIIQVTSGGEGGYEGGFAHYARDAYRMGWRENSSEFSDRWNTCATSSIYAPNVAEWSISYAGLQAGLGWTGETWTDAMVSGSVLGSHYSYQNLGQWNGYDANTFLAEKEYLVDEWQNKMGYWFKLTSATFALDLANGAPSSIVFDMANDGVARQCVINATGCVKLALMDNDQNVLQSIKLEGINPFNWAPGDTTHEMASFTFPYTEGATTLALGVFSDSTLTSPNTQLGIDNGTANNWYVLTDMLTHTGITEQQLTNGGVTIYPNPATDMVFIARTNSHDAATIELLDCAGRRIHHQLNALSTTSLDISMLRSGVYLVKVSDGYSTIYQKLIKTE